MDNKLSADKRKSVVWIIIFCVVLLSPDIMYFVFGGYVDTDNYEKRDLSSKPALTTKNYATFPKEYEAYYNDNIPFRNQLIRLNNSVDYFIFNQSSHDNVVIGDNGWLFYKGDADPLLQSLGGWMYTEEQLKTIADNLVASERVLESQGIGFILFIAPSKETIYKEEIPDYYERKSEIICTDQLVKYLKENTDIRVVYPKDELLKAKLDNPDITFYYKLDTHWNSAGAYIGALSLAEEMGLHMPPIDKASLEKFYSSTGDLTGMLNITIKDGSTDYNISGISNLDTENEKYDYNTEFIYHTPGAGNGNLFVRRDSFSTALAPIIATQFENSVFVHSNSYTNQQVFDNDADVFVYEVVERLAGGALPGFRISLVSSSVEVSEEGMKNIRIAPAIDGVKPGYVSIYKKSDMAGDTIQIQKLKPLNELVEINVPGDETGEICVKIYGDKFKKSVIEEVVVPY